MTTTCLPSPESLVECESWRNRCIRLNESRTNSLCTLLGVTASGLEMALLEARTVGMSHEVRNAAALWIESENELALAMSLMETAESIQCNRLHMELDE